MFCMKFVTHFVQVFYFVQLLGTHCTAKKNEKKKKIRLESHMCANNRILPSTLHIAINCQDLSDSLYFQQMFCIFTAQCDVIYRQMQFETIVIFSFFFFIFLLLLRKNKKKRNPINCKFVQLNFKCTDLEGSLFIHIHAHMTHNLFSFFLVFKCIIFFFHSIFSFLFIVDSPNR